MGVDLVRVDLEGRHPLSERGSFASLDPSLVGF